MTTPRPSATWPARPKERLEQRITIARDGTIVARSGKVEYGQGIRTGFALIVAEELAVPVHRVRVELGDTDTVPWDMGTFGSLSTATDGAILRAAAAHARQLLVARAANRLTVSPQMLVLRDGCVVAPDGRALSYVELTEGAPLGGVVPSTPPPPRLTASSITAPLRLEAKEIVTGALHYAADVRLPNMLRGHVLHPPTPGATLEQIDDTAARAVAGVVAIVRDGDFVGVVAERDEQALHAIDVMDTVWSPAVNSTAPDETHLTLRGDEGVDAAFAKASILREASYHLPNVAHASIGPSAAVADVREDEAHLFVATQRPFGLRDEVAELLGLAPERVHVHPQAMSGMYGRGNMSDAAIDAVRLSRAVRRPVLVQWTRGEEFALSPHRPVLDARVRAALDSSGRIVAWRYEAWTNPHTYGGGMPAAVTAMTSGRNALPPYALGAAEVLLHVVPSSVRTGAFRSLAAAPHVFAIESFMDELALASGQDPLEFRLRHLDDPRLRHVLELVRERSEWASGGRRSRRGLGVACAIYHDTYIAEVVEVVAAAEHEYRVERVWCGVDTGRLVHPDGAKNQIEGGVQQAISWTLYEELHHDDTRVTTTGWRDYRIATALDAPRTIDVAFVEDPQLPSTGVGEPGSVPTAAAVANAVARLTGQRVRQLPLVAPIAAHAPAAEVGV